MSEFEWDENKNRANIKKHGISFETASQIFENPVLTWTDKRKDYEEIREHSIGTIKGIAFIAVIHTDRNGKTRLISARRANKQERQRYEEAIRTRTLH
jgi:uncharacterized DUF497 family protein